MADKEERILIARSTDYTITDTDEGALFDGKIAPHCANVMTRQEAINRMAKAMEVPYFNDIHASEPDMLEALAESALDALIK